MAKTTLITTMLATLILAGAPPGRADEGPFRHHPGFSVRDVQGAYAFSFDGKIVGLGPVAAVGRLVADGRGNLTDAARTIVVNGRTLFQTFSCEIEVRPDGTGSAVCPVDDAPVETFDFVLEERGRAFRFAGTTPGITVLGSGRRQ